MFNSVFSGVFAPQLLVLLIKCPKICVYSDITAFIETLKIT